MKKLFFLFFIISLGNADEYDFIDPSKQKKTFFPMKNEEILSFKAKIQKIREDDYRKFRPLIQKEMSAEEILQKEKDNIRIKENFSKEFIDIEKKEVKIRTNSKEADFFDTLSNKKIAPVDIE